VRLGGSGLGDRVVEASSAELGSAVFDALERASRMAYRILERMNEQPLGATRPWLGAT